jgi:hypothetical protein
MQRTPAEIARAASTLGTKTADQRVTVMQA